jgi:hypothetical protein
LSIPVANYSSPKSFQLCMGMCIESRRPTKSTTLVFTDTGSQIFFSKWNRTPKGSSNFGNVRAYLFVDTIITIVYRVASSNQKYDPRIYQHRFPKNLSKWNRTPKGSSNFGNVRAYLFVGTIVTDVYRVVSSSTKSTTLTFTDTGSLKIF